MLGSNFSSNDATIFNAFIQDVALTDLPMGGRMFTWMNKYGSKLSKLDRFLISNSVLLAHSNMQVTVLDRVWSDHNLILLRSQKNDFGPIPFKVFHSWFERSEFNDVVKKAWHNLSGNDEVSFMSLHAKVKGLKSHLKLWLSRTKESEKQMLLVNTWQELDNLEMLESMDLLHKARVRWDVEGDENSKFCHGIINSKRKSHTIQDSMVSLEEIKSAVWDCGSQEARVPDGFSFMFVKIFWDIMKLDIQNFVVRFFSSGSFPPGSNSSFFTLIPKVLKSIFLRQIYMALGVSSIEVERMVAGTGCSASNLCFSYLGLPIGPNMNRISNWNILIDRFKNRLSGWKANMLSSGGHLTLIKSVLGSLDDKRKLAWIKWSNILASLEKGGLRVGILKAFNNSLLLKWRWRLLKSPSALWVKVLKSIHGDEKGIELKGCQNKWPLGSHCWFLVLGWHLEEINVTWTHLEKKRTRLRLYTQNHEELCIQRMETASSSKSNGVRIFIVMASEIQRRQSMSTWEDLTTRFLAQFFPPGRTAKLCNSFHQEGLVSRTYSKKRTIDQSASGKLRDRNTEESWALLEDRALYENKSWNDPKDFAKPVKAISLPQDVPSTSDLVPMTLSTTWKIPNKPLLNMHPRVPTKREAITDRIAEALPSDTVKNPKLNVNSTTSVLSARSYPMEDHQCPSQIHNSINAIKTGFNQHNEIDQSKDKTLTVNKVGTPKLKEPRQTLKDKFKNLHLNLPVLKVLAHAPIYNAILDKYVESLELGKNRSAFIQGEIPKRMEDPGLFTPSCNLGDSKPFDTLANLGSCVNIIPLYLFKRLKIGLLEETNHVFGLADGTKSFPVRIIRDVEVHTKRLKLLNDFYVLDMKKDPETPLLVGRGFLATANTVIDYRKAKIAIGEWITRLVFRVKEIDSGEEETPYWTTLGKRESYKQRPS
nr:RNA-directed DNA polymerase, eukaryota, reverse transcriptase zinc-binding domain protein [Tanacetum cinerariifolium]